MCAEDGVLSSTCEAALRRAQVAEEERELRERLRRFICEADALDAQHRQQQSAEREKALSLSKCCRPHR